MNEPFVYCKASAGSGKTFNLVKEYLTLAMVEGVAGIEGYRDEAQAYHAPLWVGILAITFTNKAANEMKTRIMDVLDAIVDFGVDPDLSSMGQPLLDELNRRRAGRSPFSERDLREMAAVLRSAILHRYSDLSVCTIDSFMHRVVRTFAHDLSQPVNFEVMIDQKDLIEHSVSNLMSLVGTSGNEKLTDIMCRFAEYNMEEGKTFDIVHALTKLCENLFSEATDPYLEGLRSHSFEEYMKMYEGYERYCNDYAEKIEALGAKAIGLIDGIGLTPDKCNRASQGFYGFFTKIKNFRESLRKNLAYMPNSYVTAVFDSPDYNGDMLCRTKTTHPGTERIAQPLRQLYEEICQMLGEPLVDYKTARLLRGSLFPMALLGELDRQMELYARDNEVLHLSEFNRLINKVVQEETTPFIYERLGSRYHHFLIDEFQDTSVLQWHNLVPLVEGGLSEKCESFVVGDGKQAIYRFRQGDVTQFVDLPKVKGMALHGMLLPQPGMSRMETLTVNRRTADAVVDFNNKFFAWLVRNHYAESDLARKIYLGPDGDSAPGQEALVQEHDLSREEPIEGFVSLEFTPPNEDEAVCAKVLEIVTRLLEELDYKQKDIYILARKKGELATIGSYLQEHRQLPHHELEMNSSESFYLSRSHVVLTLLAALRYLYNDSDKIAMSEVLHRLHALGITNSDHDEAFISNPPTPLSNVLATEGIEFDSSRLLSMDLYVCCEELLRVLRLEGKDMAYVSSLLNRAAAFAARHNQNIGDFLTWFDEHPEASASTSDGGDAIQLMTIHKAKGLQARVIICPFFDSLSPKGNIWVDSGKKFLVTDKPLPAACLRVDSCASTRFREESLAEQMANAVDDLNILYVAFTRPEEQLYVVCQQPSRNESGMTYGKVLEEYAEISGNTFGDADFHRVVKKKVAKKGKPEIPHQDCLLQPYACDNWLSKADFASKSEKSLTPLLSEKVRFGIHAHALLASIVHRGEGVEQALDAFVRREKVDDAERARLEALVHDVLTNPLTERFFDPCYTVKNECDLIDGDEVMRPDRVVFAEKETWVVDFKTGSDVGDDYTNQVRNYCRALERMGYPSVSGWLVFLQPDVKVRSVVSEGSV